MYMGIIVLVLSTYLPVYGMGRSFETFGWVLLMTYMPIHTSLLHFTQFQICWQKLYQPYGPFPSLIWRDKEATPLEPNSDDTYLCQLCAHKETLECSRC